MRAARFVGTGRALELADVPMPTLTGLQDVLVRVAGAGVCRTDLHILDGQAPLQPAPRPPYTLGHETAGWVESVGPQVDRVQVGSPVILHPAITCGMCDACRAGEDMYCPQIRFPGVDGSDGGYAEFVRTSARAVVPLAEGTDPGPLAPYADAGITAYHAVRRIKPRLNQNSSVVVLGVGGLGQFGIQLLKAVSSVDVIAIDSDAARLEFARSLGADHALLATDDGVVREVRELTQGKGADAVLDFVGEGRAPSMALAVLARGGTYSVVGYGGQVTVPTMTMITQEYEILGNFVGTYRDLVELMALERRGKIHVVTENFALNDAASAVLRLREGKVLGRAVLIP